MKRKKWANPTFGESANHIVLIRSQREKIRLFFFFYRAHSLGGLAGPRSLPQHLFHWLSICRQKFLRLPFPWLKAQSVGRSEKKNPSCHKVERILTHLASMYGGVVDARSRRNSLSLSDSGREDQSLCQDIPSGALSYHESLMKSISIDGEGR